MKKKFLVGVFTLVVSSLWAQVGINTNNPQSALDVAGNIKIGNESENAGQEGMVRWNQTKKCLECHNGESWSCLDNFRRPRERKLLMNLDNGDMIYYDGGKGWEDKKFTPVKGFKATDGTEKNIYDINNGIITIPRDGLYEIRYFLSLYGNIGGFEKFDGNSGNFESRIVRNGTIIGDVVNRVLKGAFLKGYILLAKNTDHRTIYLNKGDKVEIQFRTLGIENMVDDLEKSKPRLDLNFSLLKMYEVL